MPVATLGLLAVASVIIGLQFRFACYLDRTLPKRKRLPVWLRSRGDYKRETALRIHAYYQLVMTALLLVVALRQDFDPGPRSDLEMILAFTFALLLFGATQLVNWWLLRRWFKMGEPSV